MIVQQRIQNDPLKIEIPLSAHMIQSIISLRRSSKPTKIGLLSLLLTLNMLCKVRIKSKDINTVSNTLFIILSVIHDNTQHYCPTKQMHRNVVNNMRHQIMSWSVNCLSYLDRRALVSTFNSSIYFQFFCTRIYCLLNNWVRYEQSLISFIPQLSKQTRNYFANGRKNGCHVRKINNNINITCNFIMFISTSLRQEFMSLPDT